MALSRVYQITVAFGCLLGQVSGHLVQAKQTGKQQEPVTFKTGCVVL